MDTARLRLRKRSVVALTLALVALFSVMPAASAGGQHAHRSGIQRFLLISTDPSPSAGGPVLGFGPIHAKGVDRVVSDTKDVFRFPAGSLSVTHTPKSSHDTTDPATCLFTFTERGTYRITGGTRAYAHASGHGRYRVTAVGIGCHPNAAPQVFTLTVRARGPLNLP